MEINIQKPSLNLDSFQQLQFRFLIQVSQQFYSTLVAIESSTIISAFTFVSSSDLSQQSVSCAVTICEPGVTCPEEPTCDDDSR